MNDLSPASSATLVESLAGGLQAGTSGFRHAWLFRPLLRLLAAGNAVTVEAIARATGRPEDAVGAALADWPDTEYDEAGRVVGHGLTLNPTAHRFIVNGVRLYTWCALDTVTFPALIGLPARVESPCAGSGVPIRMTVRPDDGVTDLAPATAVVSLVLPDAATSVRTGFCAQVHFFGHRSLAGDWRTAHPGATVVSVANAYRLGREIVDALTADEAGPPAKRAPR